MAVYTHHCRGRSQPARAHTGEMVLGIRDVFTAKLATARGSSPRSRPPRRKESNGFPADSTKWRRKREIDTVAQFRVCENY